MRSKGPHKPETAYDTVRIHSLMIYTDPNEYNIFGDTMAPNLRWFPFLSKPKAGDIITTGQYMNYQIFSNLQFRPLLKNSSHGIHIESRAISGEKLPFVFIGINRLVLMSTEASNIHLYPKRRYKMVASRQVEIPFYRGIGQKCGRGFGALAQAIGRTAVPFLLKHHLPAAKRVCVDLLLFAAREIADVVSGRKYFTTAVKSVGQQTLKKQLGSGSRKATAI